MLKLTATATLVAAVLYLAMSQRKAEQLHLVHFRPEEFRAWWPVMDADLLRKLDAFRERLGRPVMVSPNPDALGRLDGSSTSMHYAGGGLVRAVDVMLPQGPSLRQAVEVAKEVGFTGIGAYPEWQPHPGLHLDVRPDRVAGAPATWSRIAGQYVEIGRAFA